MKIRIPFLLLLQQYNQFILQVTQHRYYRLYIFIDYFENDMSKVQDGNIHELRM